MEVELDRNREDAKNLFPQNGSDQAEAMDAGRALKGADAAWVGQPSSGRAPGVRNPARLRTLIRISQGMGVGIRLDRYGIFGRFSASFTAPGTNLYADTASWAFDSGNFREFSRNLSGTAVKKKSFIAIGVMSRSANVLYGLPGASLGT